MADNYSNIKSDNKINVKLIILKYTFLASSILFSVLMFSRWFWIDTSISNPEEHSFLTIPGLIVSAVDAFKTYVGNGGTFTILLFVGALEYLCIVCAALGIWGIIRTLIKKRRSRLLFASQITSLCLMALTITVIIIVTVISENMLGGIVTMKPTAKLVLSLVFLIISIVTGIFYNRMYNDRTED